MSYYLTYAQYSNIGSRPVNEDSAGVVQYPGHNMFVLCDGLGGHGMGDVASQLAVEVFKSSFHDVDDMETYLSDSFQAVQDILLTEQKKRGVSRKMKTTGVALVADQKKAYIGHVGDSRLYVFSHNKIRMRTRDHSIPELLVKSGEIKESEIRNHPDRSLLLQVIGTPWETPAYELEKPIPLRKCQAFLLCSDGFWELIEDEEMCKMLKETETAEEWLKKMLDIVRKRGHGTDMDNNTALAIRIRKE